MRQNIKKEMKQIKCTNKYTYCRNIVTHIQVYIIIKGIFFLVTFTLCHSHTHRDFTQIQFFSYSGARIGLAKELGLGISFELSCCRGMPDR